MTDDQPGVAAPVRPVRLGRRDAVFDHRADGTIYVRVTQQPGPYPRRLTEKLAQWARIAPDRVHLAQRDRAGGWRHVTYAQSLSAVRTLGAALLRRGVSSERPLAILSGNSIEHGLLALAAMHVGVPYVPVSVAYSLVSRDYGKLRYIIDLTTPALVFAEDGAAYARAIEATVPAETGVVVVDREVPGRHCTLFSELMAESPGGADEAAAAVGPDTVAKILFTSGSTGLPKGVINTQRMLCVNQAQIAHAFPFLRDHPPVLVDWTPWSHTFGGNHDFNFVLYNGGSLYIDEGKPVPGLIERSIRNLRDIAPTFYLNVPKGFEEVVAYLKREPALREKFFSRVELLFYAGASLAQHVWDEFDRLAEQTVGERIQFLAGFGSTETAPFCLIGHAEHARAGVIGLPAPGVELKLVPNAGKLEARVRGPNITPGYWRQPEQTRAAFDEEGFYCFGDAFAFVDATRPEIGFRFDGRVAEDFKLATGTWVSVNAVRASLITGLAPLLRDVVVAGSDRNYIGAIIVPDMAACAALCPGSADSLSDPRVRDAFAGKLTRLAAAATGSAARVQRAVLLRDALDIDAGEITDKGSLNQRAMLRHRAGLVAALYADPPPAEIIIAGEKR